MQQVNTKILHRYMYGIVEQSASPTDPGLMRSSPEVDSNREICWQQLVYLSNILKSTIRLETIAPLEIEARHIYEDGSSSGAFLAFAIFKTISQLSPLCPGDLPLHLAAAASNIVVARPRKAVYRTEWPESCKIKKRSFLGEAEWAWRELI